MSPLLIRGTDREYRNLLTTIQDTISDCRTQSNDISTGVVSIQSEMMNLKAYVETANQSLPTIMDGIQALGPLIKTETRSISGQFLQDGRIIRQNISLLQNHVEKSFLSQRHQLDRIEARLNQAKEDERLKRIEEVLAGLELTESPGTNVSSSSLF